MYKDLISKYNFGDSCKFHHLGIGINKISSFDQNLIEKKIYDPIQKVNVYFFYMNDFLIEFVEPADENSPVSNSLKNNLNYFHICFSTNEFEILKNKFLNMKIRQISQPVPAIAFANKKIVWFKSKELGIIEIIINE